MKYYLGVDTSNYTTSVALVNENGEVILNRKKLLRVDHGERGLRQSDALFSHVVNLPEAIEAVRGFELAAVGFSAYPRDAEGSYMPCFLAGKLCATSVAAASGVPLYAFSHQRGHVRAALHSCGMDDLIDGRFVSFHVSGGTTEVLLIENGTIEKIGGTLDLNAGQAIDRSGVMLGLDFPCGPALFALAKGARPVEKPKICVNGFECNFSGLENKVAGFLEDGADHAAVAAYVIEFVKLTLEKLVANVKVLYPGVEIVFAGGVSSNRYIADSLSGGYGVRFAAPEFSSDNAAGTSLLTKDKYLKEFGDA